MYIENSPYILNLNETPLDLFFGKPEISEYTKKHTVADPFKLILSDDTFEFFHSKAIWKVPG